MRRGSFVRGPLPKLLNDLIVSATQGIKLKKQKSVKIEMLKIKLMQLAHMLLQIQMRWGKKMISLDYLGGH